MHMQKTINHNFQFARMLVLVSGVKLDITWLVLAGMLSMLSLIEGSIPQAEFFWLPVVTHGHSPSKNIKIWKKRENSRDEDKRREEASH
uniref:Uncharacterized protein n=1 Tax=Arundo donax TaxID=35708 RepID=A0A0A9D738_ARUDO